MNDQQFYERYLRKANKKTKAQLKEDLRIDNTVRGHTLYGKQRLVCLWAQQHTNLRKDK